MTDSRRHLRTALLIAFVAAILVGTLMPGWLIESLLEETGHGVAIEKIGHVICFTGLTFFVLTLVDSRFQRPALACVVGLGAATELGQLLAVARDPSLRDFALDVLGTVLGAVAARYALRYAETSIAPPDTVLSTFD